MTAPGELRVLTYNIRSLRDDRHAVARVISACSPDVVCVQEAPRFAFWRRKCRWLATATGLALVTGGRPAGAMLLLARASLPVLGTADVLLSKAPRLHQRGLAIAVLETPLGRVTVASMHLDVVAAERLRHAAEVLSILASYPEPLVLAGDVNGLPGDPAWQLLTAQLQDAGAVAGRTGSGVRERLLDGVFVDPRLGVLSCAVPDVPELAVASDHRPVLAVLGPAG